MAKKILTLMIMLALVLTSAGITAFAEGNDVV